MKEFVQIWNNVAGRRYSSVNTADREMRELSNKLKKDCDTSTFEANFTECEGLNNKFNDDLDFSDRKDAIINRLFERRRKGQVARQPTCEFFFFNRVVYYFVSYFYLDNFLLFLL